MIDFIKNPVKMSIAFIAMVILSAIFVIRPYLKDDKIIEHDAISYYAYLPATFIYGDITLEFTEDYKGEHNFQIWAVKTPDGDKVIKMSSGLSMMYLPFFAIGHTTALLMDCDTGGYSPPYKFWLQIGSVFYLIIGLIYLAKVLKQFFKSSIVALTLLLIALGTNLLYYSAVSIYSHSYSFALIAAFLYFTIQWHQKSSLKNTIIVGLIAGLITLIRPSNIIIAFVFILYDVTSLNSLKDKVQLFIRNYKKIIVILLSFLAVWIPQFIYWKITTGSFMYYSYGEEKFFFDNPQVFKALFSFRNGVYIYSPVMVLSLVGMGLCYKNARKWFLPIIIFYIVNVYILTSWWCWWYAGLGNRAFIDSYSLMAIPFAAAVAWVFSQKQIVKYAMIAVIVLVGLLGMFHNLQYHKGAIHYDSMTAKAYFANFLSLENAPDYPYFLETIPSSEAFVGRYEAVPTFPMDAYHLAEKYEKRFNQFKAKNGVETINFHIDFDEMEAIRNLPYSLQNYADDLVNQKAFSGEYSLELTPEDPFSVELIIDDLEEGDRISVSAWKYGEGFDGHLVIASEQNFYREIKVHHKKDRQWKKMSLHTYIPDNLPDSKLKIYLWNSGKNTIYFDDLSFTIEKIKRQDP